MDKNMITHDTPTSSNIARLKYDPETGNLDIEFRSGKTYRFQDIDYDTWNALIEAPSAGQYFNQNIKGKYTNYPV